MEIENFIVNIGEFEELLEKVTVNVANNAIFEKLLPSEIWDRAGADITSLSTLAVQLKETMLLLKPEIAPTIEMRFNAVAQPLKEFRESLFKSSDDSSANSRTALEHLRKAVSEGVDFLVLAKEVKLAPSDAIMAVLRLREVYGAKDYLSTVSVPETVYVRFVTLGRRIEDVKTRLAELELTMTELKRQLDALQTEMTTFKPSIAEPEPKEALAPSPSLVSDEEKSE